MPYGPKSDAPAPRLCQRVRMNDWEKRVADAWASIDDYEDREDEFRAVIDKLVAELPDGDPIGLFERACAWDSTGHSDRAVPLYQQAIDGGLTGYRRRRAGSRCPARCATPAGSKRPSPCWR